ncbi:MAG: DUF3160 domain-containing protein [bacterium]
MFIDKNRRTQLPEQPLSSSLIGFFKHKTGLKIVIISLSALLLLAIIIVSMALSNRNRVIVQEPEPADTEPLPGLPDADKSSLSYLLGDSDIDQFKAEELVFGVFYKQPVTEIEIKNPGIKLPFNVKTDAANYYSITRHINLDDVIEDLNNNGMAVIDNPFSKEANDFYSVYQLFKEKDIPFLITNDFLIYYYQNSLKYIFKQIETDVFYKDFWDISKQLFETADNRYRERYSRLGILNDPLLEAERLEAAYFATMLELLKPKPDQILPETDKDYADETKFTAIEAKYYDFELPEYLQLDIEQELELIAQAKKIAGDPVRSPALLYNRDYGDFIIPNQYFDNDKLHNFYLANKWANSLFPLYFQSNDCADCLLDKNDWEINFIAAHLIASDFESDQEIKNRWAKIYKVISYFNGLRNELTYLHYNNALTKAFGSKADVTQILAANNPERENNLAKLQQDVAGYAFDSAQGGYDRNSLEQRKYQGMRMLQENYWPDKYIHEQLTFETIGQHNSYNKKEKNHELTSMCLPQANQTMRCRGTGFDIVNIVFNEDLNSHFYAFRNSDYQFYNEHLNEVKSHFSHFDKIDWHNSGFWSSLDIDRVLLETRKIGAFPYTQTDAWTAINLDTAASAMFSMQLPADKWELSFRREDSLQAADNIVKYNYVEPNVGLVNELLANARMLFKTLYSLELVQANDQKFKELLTDLIEIRGLIGKELVDEEFNYDDWRFINDLIGKYYLTEESEKIVKIKFVDPQSGKEYYLQQSLDKVRLLVGVHFNQNREVIVIGPIFNYEEIKK